MFLIGSIARFHPQKDHRNFIKAAGLLHKRKPDVHFLLCGEDIDSNNNILLTQIDSEEIRDNCHLLGKRKNIPEIQASLDILTMHSSFGDSFPLVVGEAMASSTPCVVTDIGDSFYLVGDTGKVVTPGNPNTLVKAWEEFIDMDRSELKKLGENARKRVLSKFSIQSVVLKYEKLYEKVVKCAA